MNVIIICPIKYTLINGVPSQTKKILHQNLEPTMASYGLSPFTLSLSSSNFPKTPHRFSRACHVPPRVTTSSESQSSYWASIESDIESYLKAAIPIRYPESVFRPMHHLTFAAPRTTAPALCVATCELVGGQRDHAMAAASAMRLMHAATYAHQHLPVTDREPGRSMKPTIRHEFNPNIELLIGDAILPFGFELLSKSMKSDDKDNDHNQLILRSIQEIARMCGSQGLIHGLLREYEHGHEWDSLDVVEKACRKKEGDFHACGAACGAILGGGDDEDIEKLRNIGSHIGMAQGLLARIKYCPEAEERAEYYIELANKELKISFGINKITQLIISALFS